MSKLTEELRTIGVYNNHGFFNDGGTRTFIAYTAGTSGRGGRSGHWQVSRFVDGRGVKTDLDAHWQDNGHKTFFWGSRAALFEEAKAWVGERYGVTDWKRSPFGGWGDAAFVTARLKELRGRVREASS